MVNIGSLDKTIYNKLVELHYSNDESVLAEALSGLIEFYGKYPALPLIAVTYNYLYESHIQKDSTDEFIDMVLEAYVDLTKEELDITLEAYKKYVYDNKYVKTNNIIDENEIYDCISLLIEQKCGCSVDLEKVMVAKKKITDHLSEERLGSVLDNVSVSEMKYHNHNDMIKEALKVFNERYSGLNEYDKKLFESLKNDDKKSEQEIISQIREEFVKLANMGLSDHALSGIISTNLNLALEQFKDMKDSEISVSDASNMLRFISAMNTSS